MKSESRAGKVRKCSFSWCPKPDSNRYGVAPEGFYVNRSRILNGTE